MCDCLVALPPARAAAPAGATATTLFAKSSDRPPGEASRLEAHPPRRDRGSLRCTYVEVDPAPNETLGVVGARPWWQWGLEHGVNEAGVAAGNEAIYTTLDPRVAPPGLLGMDLVRLGLERGDTAEATVEVMVDLLERYGQGGTGHYRTGSHDPPRPYWSSFLVADAGQAIVLETSGRVWATEPVERSRAISNRTTIPAFDAEHRHPGQPVEVTVDPRLDASRAVLAAEPVTVEAVVDHSRSHEGEQGFSVCMHAGEHGVTTASMVVELARSGSRPLARWSAGSPCCSVYVPIHVGRDLGTPLAWERFAALPRGRREALDELETSLAADVRDDDDWADEAWRRVDQVIRRP